MIWKKNKVFMKRPSDYLKVVSLMLTGIPSE